MVARLALWLSYLLSLAKIHLLIVILPLVILVDEYIKEGYFFKVSDLRAIPETARCIVRGGGLSCIKYLSHEALIVLTLLLALAMLLKKTLRRGAKR